MIQLSQSEITKKHTLLIKVCEEETKKLLTAGKNFFDSLFLSATIMSNSDTGEVKASSEVVINNRILAMSAWVGDVLKEAVHIYHNPEIDPPQLNPIRLSIEISSCLIETLVQIFSCGKSIDDAALTYICQISEASGLSLRKALYIIEQVQYEIRKAIFNDLVDQLDEEQCDLCAILLLKAIRADERIHPAEIKYFENISQLLKFDQTRLEAVEGACQLFDFSVEPKLDEEVATYVFQYLIEIAMCDRKYDPRESQLIKGIAEFLNYDKAAQDAIIQPVASRVMLKAELFQD